jgi:phosphatidylserine decarboxylase
MNSLLICFLIVLFLFVMWRFLFFFRNPQRLSSAPGNAILSPADGYVLYIRYINGSDSEVFSVKNEKRIFLHDLMFLRKSDNNLTSGWLIGITMSPFDVHYNRAPVEGYIEKTGYEFPTAVKRNFNMFPALQNLFFKKEQPYNDCPYLVHNERASFVISGGGFKIYITQIADKYVKKIVTYKDRENIKRGEVFGLIRMGSQVDVFIPDNFGPVNVNVTECQHLKAGIDIVASIFRSSHHRTGAIPDLQNG